MTEQYKDRWPSREVFGLLFVGSGLTEQEIDYLREDLLKKQDALTDCNQWFLKTPPDYGAH